MAREELDRDAVIALFTRSHGRCERCGVVLGVEWQPDWEGRGTRWSVQHRKPAGMGGTRSKGFNSPSNVLLLCGNGTTGCHGHVEHHREQARDAGFLVWQSQDPNLVPVKTPWFPDGALLLVDWTYEAAS